MAMWPTTCQGLASSNNTDDLSRGSASAEDPYIGATELSEGTYYVAISNQQQVPLPLDQFFNAAYSQPAVAFRTRGFSGSYRAEDRIGSSGGGTASPRQSPRCSLMTTRLSIIRSTMSCCTSTREAPCFWSIPSRGKVMARWGILMTKSKSRLPRQRRTVCLQWLWQSSTCRRQLVLLPSRYRQRCLECSAECWSRNQ